MTLPRVSSVRCNIWHLLCFPPLLLNEQRDISQRKGRPRLELTSFSFLPLAGFCFQESNDHSSRKSFKASVLQAPVGSLRVTVCYRLMSHDNGNLWFTLFDGLFHVSSTLNSFGLDVVLWPHAIGSLFYGLYGLNSLTFPFRAHQRPPTPPPMGNTGSRATPGGGSGVIPHHKPVQHHRLPSFTCSCCSH